VGKRPGKNWFIRKKLVKKLNDKKWRQDKYNKYDCYRGSHMADEQADRTFSI
jgi:hypothetical protein